MQSGQPPKPLRFLHKVEQADVRPMTPSAPFPQEVRVCVLVMM